MKTIDLDILRQLAKAAYEQSAYEAKEAGKNGDLEYWDASRISLGHAIAFEGLIRIELGLTEREFQLRKKKGKL